MTATTARDWHDDCRTDDDWRDWQDSDPTYDPDPDEPDHENVAALADAGYYDEIP